jgi:hypothetical protein
MQYKDIFKRLDLTKAFQGLFSTLWYAPLPCFDSKGITGHKEGEKSGKIYKLITVVNDSSKLYK